MANRLLIFALGACVLLSAVAETNGSVEETEDKVNNVTLTIACLLFGFLIFNIILLHLVMYPDPNVRSYVYNMISTTISIFCAVLINQAIFSFFLEQILPSPPPRGFGIHVGHRARLLIGLLVFMASFTMMNVLGWVFKENPLRLYAVQIIGGHITAFAGITTFGEQQWVVKSELWMVAMIVFIAAGVLGVCQLTSMSLRNRIFGEFDLRKSTQASATAPKLKRKMTVSQSELAQQAELLRKNEWRLSICEAENESAALVLSFLTQQVVAMYITGHLASLSDDGSANRYCFRDVRDMFMASLGFVVLLVLSTYWRSLVPHLTEDEGMEDPTSAKARFINLVQNFQANSMGWCFLRMGEWLMSMMISTHAVKEVANAFLMTGIAVIAVIILDLFADKVGSHQQGPDARRTSSGCLSMPVAGNKALRETPARTRGEEYEAEEGPSSHRSLLLTPSLISAEVDDELMSLYNAATEKALRTVIGGFGLLVGICWEKAFDAANETIILGSYATKHHQVIAKIGMALVNALLVLPAWLLFIVPMAKRHWTEHQDAMELQAIQAKSDRSQRGIHTILTASNVLHDKELAEALQKLVDRRPALKELLPQA